MKITCDRKALLSVMSMASGLAPKLTNRDILKNVLIDVDKSSLTAIGNDTEMMLSAMMTAVESDSQGEFLLPPSRVLPILRETSGDKVEITLDGTVIHIKVGGSKFKLNQEDSAEYPRFEMTSGDGSYYTMPGPELLKAFKRSVFASDDESTRYALGGVLLDIQGENITFAATDSRRLAAYETRCVPGEDAQKTNKPVVPRKAINHIMGILSEFHDDVQILVKNNSIWFRAGDRNFHSRLIEGRFPNYKDVIPKEQNFQIDFVVAPFLSAVRQAKIITNDESSGVDFRFTEGSARLSSKAAEIGESAILIPVSFVDEHDDKPVVMLAPDLVESFLKVLAPEDPVMIKIISSNEPVLFQAGENYQYIVMPLARD